METEQKRFVVKRLAMMFAPEDIARSFMLRWPLARCSGDDVRRLDPNEFIIDPDLTAFYNQEREAFLTNPTAAPIADPRIRAIEWQRLYEFYRGSNRLQDAERILCRVVEDQTGSADGSKGGPMPAAPITEIRRTIVDPKREAEPA